MPKEQDRSPRLLRLPCDRWSQLHPTDALHKVLLLGRLRGRKLSVTCLAEAFRSLGIHRRPKLLNRSCAKTAEPVCGEFQFTRQLGSEISHCNAVATDMSRGVRAEVWVRHCAAPVSLRPSRYDTDTGCKIPCSLRASARDRSGSKTRSDPDTRAEWFRSAARRTHANVA